MNQALTGTNLVKTKESADKNTQFSFHFEKSFRKEMLRREETSTLEFSVTDVLNIEQMKSLILNTTRLSQIK